MVWGIPLNAPGSWGGMSTVSLVTGGWMREIHPNDLRPGDAVGICGPDTGGDDGHIVLFERWASEAHDESYYWAYEQAGGQHGPVHRVINYPYGGPTGPWRAYRFRDIQDDVPPQEGDMFDQAARDNLRATDGRIRRFLSGEMTFGDDLDNERDDKPIWPNVQLAKLREEVAALRAELASRPTGGVTPEQMAEIARQTAALVGGGLAADLVARLKE